MLNMTDGIKFAAMKAFLRQTKLCTYLLRLAEEKTEYSLLTRQEAFESEHSRIDTLSQINLLYTAAIKHWEKETPKSILSMAGLESAKNIIFPDDQVNGSFGAEMAVQAFMRIVAWFRVFMSGCANGTIDVDTLNRFKHVKGVVLEFRPAKNSMTPALTVAELHNTGDDVIERKILSHFIYPFIFSGQGNDLAKIKKCRQCGAWFAGVRLSATFCGSKCRNTFHYANR